MPPATRQAAVLDALRERGGTCRLTELADALGLRKQDAWQVLRRLRELGKVEQQGRGVYALSGADTPGERIATTAEAPASPHYSPRFLAGLGKPERPGTVMERAIGNVHRMAAALANHYRDKAPETLVVELELAALHLEEALHRATGPKPI